MWQNLNQSISDLCSSAFWDPNVTWNSPDPHFTPCFEKTVLVWIPCVFLWVFLPVEIYYLRQTKSFHIPFNLYNLTKLVLIAILGALALVDIVNFVFIDKGHLIHFVDFYTPALEFVTFFLCFALTYANIKYGVRSSGVLFLFSLLLVTFGAPQFRTALGQIRYSTSLSNDSVDERETGITRNVIYIFAYLVYYPFAVALLLLNCFADARPLIQKHSFDQNVCPESQSSFLSRCFFGWFDAFAWKGYNRLLQDEDLWSVEEDLKSGHIVREFESKWHPVLYRAKEKAERVVREENQKFQMNALSREGTNGNSFRESGKKVRPASIFRPLWQAFGVEFMLGASARLVQDCLAFVSPLILKQLIAFVSDKNEYLWRGYLYAVALFAVAFIQTMFQTHYFYVMYRIGLQIRTALTTAIYKKALKISNGASRNFTLGEIVNLMAVDTQRFSDVIAMSNFVWSGPLQISLAVYFLWINLGPSVLAGLAVMIILIPVNGFFVSKVRNLQVKQMKNKDERAKLMNEILTGIKVLKLYAWEPSFEKQVTHIRDKEIEVLRYSAYLNTVTSFLWSCAPFLVSLVTFTVFVLSSDENVLDVETAFVSLSLFNILKIPCNMLPQTITALIQTSVSIKRINKFMNSEELDENAVSREERPEAIIIDNGQFSWDSFEGLPVLNNINLNVKPGALVAVLGPVGAGKSSLLSAILGEMYRQSGFVNVSGDLAYVPQQAWIQNATLKDNITFSTAFNGAIYEKVLEACALKMDLEVLPAGDRTEIGEKGINLSGGQKQRISLARALYSDADIYLLDDPLSAVDSHVGKHIFERAIGPNGLLRRKTRILVTHSVTYLPQVDFIIVLKDGTISESGTYNELVEKKGDFAEFLATYLKEDNNGAAGEIGIEDEDDNELQETISRQRLRSSGESASVQFTRRQKSVSESSADVKKPEVIGQKLVETEKTEIGSIKWNVCVYYLRAIGPFMMAVTILTNILFQIFTVASNYWLSIWSSDTSAVVDGHQDVVKRNIYLGIYGLLGLGLACMQVLRSLSLNLGATKAAADIHRYLLARFMRWPMSIFDTTPVGRILNRFTYDISVIDKDLPEKFSAVLNDSLSLCSTGFVICYSTPLFAVVILPMGIIYYCIQRFYAVTSRQLKRMESTSRSPIFSHFGETVSGVQSIRAYGLEEKFIEICEKKIDYNQNNYYTGISASQWVSVRLKIIGNFVIFFSALFAVFSRDTLNAGLVGLSVSYALQITPMLSWLVRTFSDLETSIVAVERIKEYNEIEPEAPWKRSDENVPTVWPANGEVEFDNFQVRYRDGLEVVLKGISFHIRGGEKVGVVGRTGAGKSSLTLSLFRIIEAAAGKILIDGVDIARIGLHTLRERLTIIPQDPVLFSGTLRMNLDPMEKYSDESVWRALELAHLKTKVANLNFGLQHQVAGGGDNFSVGQRQLICLARALLRKTKVLILDEATAAIDLETDDVIQSTIRREFEDCTVLTIAHRLNTIMDYDRLIVLDQGEVVEFDSPDKLLDSDQSIFRKMAEDANLL